MLIFELIFVFLFEANTMFVLLLIAALIADDGKFLLAARKFRRPTCIDYIISLDADDMSRESNAYVGKLRSTLNQIILLFSCFLVQRLTAFIFTFDKIKFFGNQVYNLRYPAASCWGKDDKKLLH